MRVQEKGTHVAATGQRRTCAQSPEADASTGALSVRSGAKTGRSPKDKRIVDDAVNTGNVWWGTVNIKMEEDSFLVNRERAIDYLNSVEQVFVFDGYAGWHPDHQIKIRVISSRAYHALFMHNMLIRPRTTRGFRHARLRHLQRGRFPLQPPEQGADFVRALVRELRL